MVIKRLMLKNVLLMGQVICLMLIYQIKLKNNYEGDVGDENMIEQVFDAKT